MHLRDDNSHCQSRLAAGLVKLSSIILPTDD